MKNFRGLREPCLGAKAFKQHSGLVLGNMHILCFTLQMGGRLERRPEGRQALAWDTSPSRAATQMRAGFAFGPVNDVEDPIKVPRRLREKGGEGRTASVPSTHRRYNHTMQLDGGLFREVWGRLGKHYAEKE